jgi:hypothetical protein
MHQIHGRLATATRMAHIQECTVEYQRIANRNEKTGCRACWRSNSRKRIGFNKVKLSRDLTARVRFPAASRRPASTTSKLGSTKLAIGATLPIIYAPDNPAALRAVLSWDRPKTLPTMLVIDAVFLALAFRVQPLLRHKSLAGNPAGG